MWILNVTNSTSCTTCKHTFAYIVNFKCHSKVPCKNIEKDIALHARLPVGNPQSVMLMQVIREMQ